MVRLAFYGYIQEAILLSFETVYICFCFEGLYGGFSLPPTRVEGHPSSRLSLAEENGIIGFYPLSLSNELCPRRSKLYLSRQLKWSCRTESIEIEVEGSTSGFAPSVLYIGTMKESNIKRVLND
jgi:hypothetical protein